MNPTPTFDVHLTAEDYDTSIFLNSLVMGMLGYSVLDIPEANREAVISDCVEAFSDYLVKFTEIKYGKIESIRLKAAHTFSDPKMFSKFGELGNIFEDAFKSFLNFLNRRWDDKSKKLQADKI